jgi:hypothetical protein
MLPSMIDLTLSLLSVAAILVALHFAAIRRITDFGVDAQARWRYRDGDPGDELRASSRPYRSELQASRAFARGLLMVALALPVIVLIVLVLRPGTIGHEPWYLTALPWAGGLGYLVGLAWMIRIYRADPEAGATTWRYRS